jgi:DICT domain-containing protein
MRAVYDDLAERDRTLYVHGGAAPPAGVRDLLDGFGIDVETVDAGLRLPPGRAVFSVDGSPRGQTSLAELRRYVEEDPDGAVRPGVLSAVTPDRTALRSESTAKLLAVSRHLESVAYRARAGRVVAGFQTLSTYVDDGTTREAYRRIARRGADVTVCGVPDADAEDEDAGVHVYRDEDGRFADYWFVLVDGGTTARMGLLVAEETSPDRFTGWWTRHAATVADALETAQASYPALFDRE